MRDITVFPKELERVNERVAELTLKNPLSRDEQSTEGLELITKYGIEQDYRTCELVLQLKNGRAYGFMAATPEYLRDYMERENLPSFVVLGLLVVREMTEEAILHALETCLDEAAYFGVEPLGYRMSDRGNVEDDFEDDEDDVGEHSSPE